MGKNFEGFDVLDVSVRGGCHIKDKQDGNEY